MEKKIRNDDGQIEKKKSFFGDFAPKDLIALLALILSLFTIVENHWVKQEGSVSIARWSTNVLSDTTIDARIFVTVVNTGNKSFVINQVPVLVVDKSQKNLLATDDVPLERQPQPTLLEAGKAVVIPVRITLDLGKRADDIFIKRNEDAGDPDPKDERTQSVLLVATIQTLNPDGTFGLGTTGCVRIPFKYGRPLPMTADPRLFPLKITKLEDMKGGLHPCSDPDSGKYSQRNA